jgi:hypothetical protein
LGGKFLGRLDIAEFGQKLARSCKPLYFKLAGRTALEVTANRGCLALSEFTIQVRYQFQLYFAAVHDKTSITPFR